MKRSVNVAARNNLFLVAARKKKKRKKKGRKNLKKFSRQRAQFFNPSILHDSRNNTRQGIHSPYFEELTIAVRCLKIFRIKKKSEFRDRIEQNYFFPILSIYENLIFRYCVLL